MGNKIRDLPGSKMVSIQWEDASFNQGYYDEKDSSTYDVIHNNTVGYLIKTDKKVVIVATDKWSSPEKNFRHISTIPRGMIKKITYLKGINDGKQEE